jgi:hypothetical protein
MKKRVTRKLVLHKTVLMNLTPDNEAYVAGGTAVSGCASWCATCNQSCYCATYTCDPCFETLPCTQSGWTCAVNCTDPAVCDTQVSC